MDPVELRPGLRRRVFFGVRLADREDDRDGVQVVQVHPGSSAAACGVIVGDRILAIDGVPVTSGVACQRLIKDMAPETEFEIALLRSAQRLYRRGTAHPWPTESFPGSTLILDHVGTQGRRQRIFVTRPDAAGPRPAVMMLRGFSCRSSEFPLAPRTPLRVLLSAWAAAGYATLRVEKLGVGDSEGPPCPDADFVSELAGARAGLDYLRALPWIDSARLAVFGHSVGGMIAPLLAAERPIAGIGTLGTSADRFSDCAAASRRRQLALGGADLDDLPALEALQSLIIRDRLPPEVALRQRPDLAPLVPRLLPGGRIFGRSLTYVRELDQAAIEAAWEAIHAEIAIFHAEYDYVCTRDEAARIVHRVNTRGCGRARLVELPGAGHLLYTHASLEDAFDEPERGEVDTTIVDESLAWLSRAFA